MAEVNILHSIGLLPPFTLISSSTFIDFFIKYLSFLEFTLRRSIEGSYSSYKSKICLAGNSFLKILLKDQKMEKLNLWPDVTGKVTPLFLVKRSQYYLKGFKWNDAIRPKDQYDIFRIPEEMRQMLDSPEAVVPVARIRGEE